MTLQATTSAAGHRRIRHRLLLPALAVALSLAGLAVWRAVDSRNTQLALARASTLAIAGSSAQSLDATIAGTRTLLFGIRELAALRLPREVNDSILARTDAGSTIPIADLRFFDTAGTLLGSSRYQNRGPAPPGMFESPMFRRAVATRSFTVGSVRRAATLPGTPHLLSMVLPLVDSATAEVTGFAAAALFIDSLATVRSIDARQDGTVLTLVDSSGIITYRSIDTDRWLGRAYAADSVLPSALRSGSSDAAIVGTERLQAAPLSLHLAVPVAPILRSARNAFFTDLLIGGLLVLFVLWICYRSVIAVVEPIESLTADVSAVADGDMSRRSQLNSPDEVGDLSRTFNRMADTIVQRDVALRESQERLLHAQKMEAVGQFASGIAHDFNNYLQIIVAHAGIVQANLPPASEDRKEIDEVLAATARASGLTRQILAFSRKQVVEPRVVDVAATIAELTRVLRRMAGDGRTVSVAHCDAPTPVLIDPGELEQVIVNLVANARDATTETGRIRIDTRIAAADGSPATVCVTVSDDGDGIPADVRERIFEPFFTTKRRDHGTGLGLSIVYGIVSRAGGSIEVHSAPAQGTTFRIELPLAAASTDA